MLSFPGDGGGPVQAAAAVPRHAGAGGQRQLLHRQEVRRHKLDRGPGKVGGVRGDRSRQGGPGGKDEIGTNTQETRSRSKDVVMCAGVEEQHGRSGGAEHQQEPGGLGHGWQHRRV